MGFPRRREQAARARSRQESQISVSILCRRGVYKSKLTVCRHLGYIRVVAIAVRVPWNQSTMSRVENLEEQVKQLTAEELRAFREWFAQFDAEVWDRQFESDAQSGKLDELAARALRDHTARRTTKL
jgi:hypothetical protein